MFNHNFVTVVFLLLSISNFPLNSNSSDSQILKSDVNNYLKNYDLSDNEISFTPDKIFEHYYDRVDIIVWENKEDYFSLRIREGNRVLYYSTKYFNNINFQEIKNLDPGKNYILEKNDMGEINIKIM